MKAAVDRIEELNETQQKELFSMIVERLAEDAGTKVLVANIQSKQQNIDPEELKTFLKKSLPKYMVPDLFSVFTEFPKLPNGKIDRQVIRQVHTGQNISQKESKSSPMFERVKPHWEKALNYSPAKPKDDFFEMGGDSIRSIQLSSMLHQQNIEMNADLLFDHSRLSDLCQALEEIQTKQEPESDNTVEILLKVWAEVLQYSPVHENDDFFEHGGDSIRSIQLVAKAQKVGLHFTADQLFDHSSPKSLLKVIDIQTNTADIEETIVQLTPIQNWFFDRHNGDNRLWNQSLCFELDASISTQEVKEAFGTLRDRHESLRLAFENQSGKWRVRISESEDDWFYEISESSIEQSAGDTCLSVMHKNQSLEKGNLFQVAIFNPGPSKQKLIVISAHHLVIDQRSWEIVLQDLHDLFSKKTINNSAPSGTYTQWSASLAELAKSESLLADVDYWKTMELNPSHYPFDLEHELPYSELSKASFSYEIDEDLKLSLDRQSDNEGPEGLKALLILAYSKTLSEWCGQSSVCIGLEEHGRQPLAGQSADIINTTGWFTNYYPISLPSKSQGKLEVTLQECIDTLNQTPNHGLSYGLLKYLNPDVELNSSPIRFGFNYWGHFQLFESDLIQNTKVVSYLTADPESKNDIVIELNCFKEKDKFVLRWTYSSSIHHETTIKSLCQKFVSHLKDILNQNQIDPGKANFKSSGLSDQDLANLLGSLD